MKTHFFTAPYILYPYVCETGFGYPETEKLLIISKEQSDSCGGECIA